MKEKLATTRHSETTPSVQGQADWETLTQLQATISHTAEKVEDRRKAFLATPDDIETIHRFRTNARTLRSFIAFIKPWQNAEQNAEIQTTLRDIVRHTSRLRELDVLEQQVRKDPEASPKLIALCKKEAAAERAKVRKILASKKVAKLFVHAMSSTKNIVWKKRFAQHGLPQSAVRERFDSMVESVNADLATLDLRDAERAHDVRKRAKRARYVAEHYKAILGSDAVEIAADMNAHQDNLGDVCDARANIRLIDEFSQLRLPKPVKKDLKRMRAQNEAFLHDALNACDAKA